MALSCTISEIKRDRPISRKSRFFRTPALVARIREIPVGILPKGSIRKNRMVWLADRKKSLRIWLLVLIHYTNVLTWRIAGQKFWRRRRFVLSQPGTVTYRQKQCSRHSSGTVASPGTLASWGTVVSRGSGWGSCHQTNLYGDGGCVKPSQYRCLDHVTCYNYT